MTGGRLKRVKEYIGSETFLMTYGDGDSGIMYDDVGINIEWPFEKICGKENLIISDKDLNLMSFDDYKMRIKH